jgi:hypothetical protein
MTWRLNLEALYPYKISRPKLLYYPVIKNPLKNDKFTSFRMTLSCNAILLLLVIIILLASVISLLLTSDNNYSNILQLKARGSESILLSGNDNAKPLEGQVHSIHICCGWSPDKVGNEGTGLTYKIIGSSPAIEQAVHNAIKEWVNDIKGVKFIELKSSNNIVADITIKFNSKSSQDKMTKEIPSADNTESDRPFLKAEAPGHSRIHVNLARFITDVETTISKTAFDEKLSYDMIEQITKHELGHALGLGEANFDGDLMSPTLNDESKHVSQCDISAVDKANHITTESKDDEQNIEDNSFNCV